MSRPVTSSVSALSGVVANGRRAMHHVSSSLSKIPYGGFSPVRLQIGLRPRPSPFGAYTRPIVRSSVGNDPLSGQAPLPRCTRDLLPDGPIQRPLARRRVMLSRQLKRYYGLIRGPRSLPPVYELSGGSLPHTHGAGAEGFPVLLCVSF